MMMRLRAVVANGLDRAAFLGFLAERLFRGGGGLFLHERVPAALVAVKIIGRRLAAQVAVDALRVDVKRALGVVGVFIRFVCHGHSLKGAIVSYLQYDFAEILARFHPLVGRGRVFQRHHLVDRRNERALLHHRDHAQELGEAAHVRADDADLLREQMADVHLGLRPRGGPAGDHAAAPCEAREVLLPGLRPDVLEDHVHAAASGQLLHGLVKIPGLVEDHLVGAELLRARDLAVVADGRVHGGAEKLRDLDGGAPDAGPCRMDEHGLPRLDIGPRDQHVVGRQRGERHRGPFFERVFFRNGYHEALVHGDALGVSALGLEAEYLEVGRVAVPGGVAVRRAVWRKLTRRDDHAVAFFEAPDALAGFEHGAGDVGARDVRKRYRDAGKALTHPYVEVVEGTRRDFDEDVVQVNGGVFERAVLEDVRPAVFLKKNRFQQQLLMNPTNKRTPTPGA